jgi:hypothetical protein
MAGSGAEEEEGNQSLSRGDVKALIAEERSSVRDELKKEFEAEAARKDRRYEEVIGSQAKQIADLQAAKAAAAEPAVKKYCVFGTDGDGRGNAWPSRLRNEIDRDVPHCYDLGEDHTYQTLVGANRGFRNEYRTLAGIGSYLSDFSLEFGGILGDLREEGGAELEASADRLENTLKGISDLAAVRFGLIKELVNKDTTPQRKRFLEDKFFPREGVTGPASTLSAWNERYDTAVSTQLEKQLAISAARVAANPSHTDPGDGGGGGGGRRSTPRFQRTRTGARQ